ncbi:MAG: hypothetical protein V1776_04000 [Candidatus Diapherotrites archaeon]
MDTLTYAVAVFLLAIAMQYPITWLGLIILLFLLLSLHSISGILLTLVTGITFFFLGGELQGELFYIIVGLVILAYLIGVKPSEDTPEGMSPDMMAMLQGMGGQGDQYGGMGGMGGMGEYR